MCNFGDANAETFFAWTLEIKRILNKKSDKDTKIFDELIFNPRIKFLVLTKSVAALGDAFKRS